VLHPGGDGRTVVRGVRIDLVSGELTAGKIVNYVDGFLADARRPSARDVSAETFLGVYLGDAGRPMLVSR